MPFIIILVVNGQKDPLLPSNALVTVAGHRQSSRRSAAVFKRGWSTGTTAGYTERIISNVRIQGWPPAMTARAVLITN